MYRRGILLLVMGIAAVLLLGCSLATNHVREAKDIGLEENPVKISENSCPNSKKSIFSVETDGGSAKTEATKDEEKSGTKDLSVNAAEEEDLESMVSVEEEAVPEDKEDPLEKHDASAETPEKIPSAEQTGKAPSENSTGNVSLPDKPAANPIPAPTEPISPKEEESPSRYKDSLGHIRCERIDGTWYEYIYSTADVTLAAESTDRALFFLNWDGSYDDYEVYKIECEKKLNNHGKTVYAYHVTYVKKIPMETAMPAALVSEEELCASALAEEGFPEEIPLYDFRDATADETGNVEEPETPENPENSEEPEHSKNTENTETPENPENPESTKIPENPKDPENAKAPEYPEEPAEEEILADSEEEADPNIPEEDTTKLEEKEKDISQEIVNKGGTFNEYDAEPDLADGPVRADDDAGLLQESGARDGSF